jgi:hypothetical protein
VDGQPETRYVTTRDGVAIAYHVLGRGELDIVWSPAVSYPFDLLREEPNFVHWRRAGRGIRCFVNASPASSDSANHPIRRRQAFGMR